MKQLLLKLLGLEGIERDYRLLSEFVMQEHTAQQKKNLHFEGAINGLRARVKSRNETEEQPWLS